MQRKQKTNTDSLDVSRKAADRPIRKSCPSMLNPSELQKDELTVDNSKRKKSSDKRKVSRVHLGRLQFLPEDSFDDDLDPDSPVTLQDYFLAASSGRLRTVTRFLDEGGDVNSLDSCDRTALHRASLYEQTAIVNLLIDRGANVNIADMLSNTPLHWACRGTSIEIVQILLSNKAKVNKKDQLQNTPLHVATRVGFIECVNYLIENGARINDKDCEGDTPIHDAIRLARPKVVRSLILHGANMSMKNMNGKTAADMMQAWYNSTKDAILYAEKERKRKGLDVEKIALELKKEEEVEIGANVDVKRFSIDSYESWKSDLMNCDPTVRRRGSKNGASSMTRQNNTDQEHPQILIPLPEEYEDAEESTDMRASGSLPKAQIVSIQDHLSSDDCKALTRMEKATTIIDEDPIVGHNVGSFE